MARLITTKAEKDAASFLDWDDAALGRYCKKLALELKAWRDKKRQGPVSADNFQEVMTASDGMLLLMTMVDCDAGEMHLRFDDFIHAGMQCGSWEIHIRKIESCKP